MKEESDLEEGRKVKEEEEEHSDLEEGREVEEEEL